MGRPLTLRVVRVVDGPLPASLPALQLRTEGNVRWACG